MAVPKRDRKGERLIMEARKSENSWMALSVKDFITGLRESRRHFLKHIKGITPEQMDWKPYPNCLSIRETVQHLIVDDRAALESLQTGSEPHYERHTVKETDFDRLVILLNKSHEALVGFLDEEYGPETFDTLGFAWGQAMPIAQAIVHFSSEDHYHAGQVAFIRQATDPAWSYYKEIYGWRG